MTWLPWFDNAVAIVKSLWQFKSKQSYCYQSQCFCSQVLGTSTSRVSLEIDSTTNCVYNANELFFSSSITSNKLEFTCRDFHLPLRQTSSVLMTVLDLLVLFDDSIIKVRKLIAAGVSVDGPPRSPGPYYMASFTCLFLLLFSLSIILVPHLYDAVIKQHQHSH